jgi:hypothetical protein
MGKTLALLAVTFFLASGELALACSSHPAPKSELQAKFSGGSGRRVPGVGGVATKNRGNSGSALDPEFFSKINQNGEDTGTFNTGFGGDGANTSAK